jgi:hypothetical protein
MKIALIALLLFVTPFVLAMGEKAPPPAGSDAASSSSVSSTAAADSVWVGKPDGSQSCSAGSGQTLDMGAEQLKQANIHVLSSHKMSEAKMHMQLCGIPTGVSNVYEISRADLARALALGYREAATK